MPETLPTLVTIPISHYGERARWALDHAGLDYHEVHHLQMFSWVASLSRGGGKTVPILLTGSGVLRDSADIVRYASERAEIPLYPNDPAAREEVLRLEEGYAGAYGVETRRVVYEWFLRSFGEGLEYNAGRAPAYQTAALSIGRHLAMPFVRSYLAVSEEARARDVVSITRVMDEVSERLRDGRPYLCGEQLSAADVTFAAMTAPSILPEQYPVRLPRLEEIPPDAADQIRRWREHPAGGYALRLYAERPLPRGRYLRPLRAR